MSVTTPRRAPTLPCIALLATAACDDDDEGACPDGSTARDGRCIGPDTGHDAGDAQVDASDTDAPDTGACPMTCALPQVCDASGACVRCLTDAECGGETPRCLERACVACSTATASTDCNAPTALCSAAGSCVECTGATDCTTPALAGCNDAGEGAACTRDGDCVGTGLAACVSGVCLECSATNETACDGNSCDPVAFACTETPTGRTGRCRTCLADSECEADHYCIALQYMGAETRKLLPQGHLRRRLPPTALHLADGTHFALGTGGRTLLRPRRDPHHL